MGGDRESWAEKRTDKKAEQQEKQRGGREGPSRQHRVPCVQDTAVVR